LSSRGAEVDRASAPLTIVVPVYNEAANFPALWKEVTASVNSPFTAIVVYDFDEDDTVPVVRQLIVQGEHRVRLLRNNYGRGVVGAIRSGFDAAEQGPVLVIMADLSDDLRAVDDMVRVYEAGFDVVVGSRYMPGGGIQGGPLLKKTLSRLAGVSLFHLRGLPTHDATNAFKIYDAAMLKALRIESRGGFEMNLELTVKAFLGGYRIAEVPTVWRDRTAGESRFRLWKWLPSYLHWYLKAFQRRRPGRDI
jgi:glycosyltransferase involved in cell wall biosynthesis